MLTPETIARMTKEQKLWLSQQGNRAREIIRLSQEPQEYMPIPKQFQRFAIIGSLEFDKPMVRTALFFDCGHMGRYQTIVGNNEIEWQTGWYNGIDNLAHLIPPAKMFY